MLDANALPNDVASLKRLLLERDREVEHLKLQLARLRRWRFGESSEQLSGTGQLPLSLEELAAAIAEIKAGTDTAETSPARGKPVRRKKLPEHFERLDELIEPPECRCPECGGTLQSFGTPDEAEVLEAKCAISRFGPTRFLDLGPTFPEFPAEPSERMFTRLSSWPQACGLSPRGSSLR